MTRTGIMTSPILHPQPRSKRPLLEAAESKRPQRERESQPPLYRTQMTTCLVSHRKSLPLYPLEKKDNHAHTHTPSILPTPIPHSLLSFLVRPGILRTSP